ncbi:hypothetical protein M885DRAFT_515805 [Pelagophyceae sp. CCMP2097]|nr:hypothetical protein M885DRAFT_515805 [Pelagophyceae sp. CCMP2097]
MDLSTSQLVLVPVLAVVLSAAPPAFLGLLARVHGEWPAHFGNIGLGLKALGVASLASGHVMLCAKKRGVVRADLFFFCAMAGLGSFFGGNWYGTPVPITSLGCGGVAFLGFFGPAFLGAMKGSAVLPKVATGAAVLGSCSLAFIGLARMPEVVKDGAMVAALCFILANTIMFLLNLHGGLLHSVPFVAKLFGSFCLLGGNGLGYGWQTRATLESIPAVFGAPLADKLYDSPMPAALVFLVVVPLVVERAGLFAIKTKRE